MLLRRYHHMRISLRLWAYYIGAWRLECHQKNLCLRFCNFPFRDFFIFIFLFLSLR